MEDTEVTALVLTYILLVPTIYFMDNLLFVPPEGKSYFAMPTAVFGFCLFWLLAYDGYHIKQLIDKGETDHAINLVLVIAIPSIILFFMFIPHFC
jgi:hypothetical protein